MNGGAKIDHLPHSEFTEEWTMEGCRSGFDAHWRRVFCGVPEGCTRWNCMRESDGRFESRGGAIGKWRGIMGWRGRQCGRCWSTPSHLATSARSRCGGRSWGRGRASSTLFWRTTSSGLASNATRPSASSTGCVRSMPSLAVHHRQGLRA